MPFNNGAHVSGLIWSLLNESVASRVVSILSNAYRGIESCSQANREGSAYAVAKREARACLLA